MSEPQQLSTVGGQGNPIASALLEALQVMPKADLYLIRAAQAAT